MSLSRFLARRSKGVIHVTAVLIILAIGWLDWVTGREISLFALYAIPIFLVVWYGDKNVGLGCAFLSAFVWWWVNKDFNSFTTSYGYLIATVSRLACFIFFALGGAAVKSRHDTDRARIEALERARDALERARKLEREIVGVSEREQCRIGRDLHDGLCQTLAAIGCAATSLKNELQKTSPSQAAAAEDIEDLLNDAVIEARDLARGISPVDMGEYGLAAALNDLAERTSRLTPISVTFEALGESEQVDPETALNLYRIVQEATANAVRHSQAARVEIALTRQGQHFNLSVTDDGVGIPQPLPSNGGIGMQTMSYRAQVVGAELHITPNHPRGTCVSCSLGANPDPASGLKTPL